MSGRGRWTRCLAYVWAALQVLSPGASALADGLIARDNASAPLVHVEAPGSKTCPEVHPPDCGVCRYLSTGSEAPAAPTFRPVERTHVLPTTARGARYASPNATLPHGRAPPTV